MRDAKSPNQMTQEEGRRVPRAHVDIPLPDGPDVFGQEGIESNIKPNTTGAGERKDRS